MANLSSDHKLLRVKTEKTEDEVVIPVSSVVTQIMKKYDGAPKRISHQKFNSYLKDVAKLAGINAPTCLRWQ